MVHDQAFLKIPDILELLPISRSSWFKGLKTGQYPPGVLLSPRVRIWPRSSIEKLIADLSAQGETR